MFCWNIAKSADFCKILLKHTKWTLTKVRIKIVPLLILDVIQLKNCLWWSNNNLLHYQTKFQNDPTVIESYKIAWNDHPLQSEIKNGKSTICKTLRWADRWHLVAPNNNHHVRSWKTGMGNLFVKVDSVSFLPVRYWNQFNCEI